MVTEILILLAGLALVVLGADWLVDGSSTIARKAGLSEFVIGLTIVGIGTSTPELVVSLTGALKGNADIAIGNIVGSNIFNTLFILGFTALIRPISMTRDNVKTDIPLNIITTVLLIIFGMHFTLFGIGNDNTLSRLDGVIFLILFSACHKLIGYGFCFVKLALFKCDSDLVAEVYFGRRIAYLLPLGVFNLHFCIYKKHRFFG